MMNKGFSYLILPALFLFSSVNAVAGDGRYFIATGLGNSQFQLNEADIVASYSSLTGTSMFNESTTSFNLLGGIQLDEYLSLEAELLSAGDITARDAGQAFKLFDVSALAITTTMSRQVTPRTRVFTRLGVHLWDISEPFGNLDIINSGVDLTYGFGADFNVYGGRSRQLRAQWNHYEYDGVFIDSSDSISISLLFLIGAE